jgi:hypothetical protein
MTYKHYASLVRNTLDLPRTGDQQSLYRTVLVEILYHFGGWYYFRDNSERRGIVL